MQQQLQIAKEASLRVSPDHEAEQDSNDMPGAESDAAADDDSDVVDELMQGTGSQGSSPIIEP